MSKPPRIHLPPTFPIEPAAKATPPDIEEMLNKMTTQSIRKLAAAKGADGKGTRAPASQRG